MKIILDESVPQKLRHLIGRDHTVVTTAFQGWSGLQNGDLLKAVGEEGFDVLITADQNLSYQQNMKGRELSLIVLNTNSWDLLRTNVSGIDNALDAATPGSYAEVEIPLRNN